MGNSRTFTDTFNDDMRICLDGPKLHIKASQKSRYEGVKEVPMSFSAEQAKEIRDHLIKMFPLPVCTGETSVESVGDMTSITTPGGSIVINATGKVINQK